MTTLPPALGVMMSCAFIFLLLIVCAVVFLLFKIRQLGKQIDDMSHMIRTIMIRTKSQEDAPSKTTSKNLASDIRTGPPSKETSFSRDSLDNTKSVINRLSSSSPNNLLNSGERSNSLFGASGTTPSARSPLGGLSSAGSQSSPTSTTQPVSTSLQQETLDQISPLYSSQEKRDDRRISQPNDIFIDIDQDTYSQIVQGEKVQLLFEKRGSYIISPFVCINNCLYVNFHFYNEKKPLTADKEILLTKAFEIDGSLPGNIKKCTPATLVQRGDKYYVTILGKIELA